MTKLHPTKKARSTKYLDLVRENIQMRGPYQVRKQAHTSLILSFVTVSKKIRKQNRILYEKQAEAGRLCTANAESEKSENNLMK